MILADLLLREWRPRSQVRTRATPVPRSAVPCVDVHNHLGRWLSPDGNWLVPDVSGLLRTMDDCGVATVVNLDGRWGAELTENLSRYDRAHPGRFVTFAHLDWAFRFCETDDEAFGYAPGYGEGTGQVPPQGRWDISAADLPADLLPGLYAGNARRILAQALTRFD